jgi:hypothetical protein
MTITLAGIAFVIGVFVGCAIGALIWGRTWS